ncbi:hypothetical protein [Curtobacterium flaccumfaciens]|uniref:hypothetical protein n=1 Tax=Curtobacterium flaccumfaciens TaxID=2035 RepID=UPI00217D6964|nr:hypothetical protein [Curtobacterium flaccumfaciens]MCS6588088.1 hypothetical protein [Curtobacterium flaccumfaciens pv. flaccumfaciens]
MSQNTRSAFKAAAAIGAVLLLMVVGLVVPGPGDGGGRRFWVFMFALGAVLLGVWRMALTIWMNRIDTPAAVEDEEQKHRNGALLLDVFTVVLGAPAAFLGALSFLVST